MGYSFSSCLEMETPVSHISLSKAGGCGGFQWWQNTKMHGAIRKALETPQPRFSNSPYIFKDLPESLLFTQ